MSQLSLNRVNFLAIPSPQHWGPNNRFVGIGPISAKLMDHAWISAEPMNLSVLVYIPLFKVSSYNIQLIFVFMQYLEKPKG